MLMQSYGDKSGIAIEPILGVHTRGLAYSQLRYRTKSFAEKTPVSLMSKELFANRAKSFADYRGLFVYSIMASSGLGGEHTVYQPPGFGESIKLELDVQRTKNGPEEKSLFLPVRGGNVK